MCRFAPSDETQMIDWYNLDWDFDQLGPKLFVNFFLSGPLSMKTLAGSSPCVIRNKLLTKYKVLPEWLFYWWSTLDECVSIHEADIAERADFWLQDCDPEIFDDQLWTIYVMTCRSI